MNTKMLLGAVIGGIAFFLLGWLIWGIALAGMMESYSNVACMRPEEEMNLGLVAVANLCWGLAFAYIFDKATLNTFAAGAMAGAILSVLIGLSFDLMMYAFTTMSTSLTPSAINVAGNIVVGGLGGGVIAWWLGRK